MKKNIPIFSLSKSLGSNSGFTISLLEKSYVSYDATQPHRHNYFEVLFFNDKGGFHEIDFTNYGIDKYSLHFVLPGQVHLLRRSNNVTGYVISFSYDFLFESISRPLLEETGLLTQLEESPVLNLNKTVLLKKSQDLLNELYFEFTNVNSDKLIAISFLFASFLVTVKRIKDLPGKLTERIKQLTEISKKFKSLVEANYKEHKTVSDYASLLNISSGHLNDTCKKDFGKPASQLVYERLVLEAKRLLYHSPDSIKEIAADLNFQDASYFSRFFKGHTQLTPDEFRKHIREKYQ